MYRAHRLVEGETYHVYNRGAHKKEVFLKEEDYRRFTLLLYLANNTERIHLSNLLSSKKYQGQSLLKIFEEKLADKSLVDLIAYCLMPNHFHLVLRPKKEGSLTLFMKKLLTAYSMYFNTKYDHSGVLFQGPFKSRHIGEEAYFRYIYSYIHLNPVGLIEPQWKENKIKQPGEVKNFISAYRHSSFFDYSVGQRPERELLDYEEAPPFLKEMNDLEELLKEYHSQQGLSLLKVGDSTKELL